MQLANLFEIEINSKLNKYQNRTSQQFRFVWTNHK